MVVTTRGVIKKVTIMATINHIKNSALIAAAFVLSSYAPVSAMTLSGQVEQHRDVEVTAPASPSTMLKSAQPTQAALNPNTFPKNYLGTWSCQTTVTDSTASQVAPGQVIESEVNFYPTADGRVQARWNQPGWVETQTVAYTFGKNKDEAKSDRTTYYFGDNAQGSWAARARDQFTLTAADTITAKSYVDQYVDGQYVGRYRTVSVLKRTATDNELASR